jgi:hypothetical protein
MAWMVWWLVWFPFQHPESVLPFGHTLVVSDIGAFGKPDGKLWKRTEKGWTPWVSGFQDPKGLATDGHRLYIADVDRVWWVDSQGKQGLFLTPRMFSPRPRFLNDALVVGDTLYLSDTENGRVYAFSLSRRQLLTSWKVPKANGLFSNDQGVWCVSFTNPARLYRLEHEGKTTRVAEVGADGGDGLWIWKGTFYIGGFRNGTVVTLRGKEPGVAVKGLTTPADFSIWKDTLWIPLLQKGELFCLPLNGQR